MKKIFAFLFIFVSVVNIIGCKQNQIVASWQIESVELQNLDEVLQVLIDVQTPAINYNLKEIDSLIANTSNNEEKQEFELTKQQLTEAKAKLIPDSLKAQYKKEFDKIVGILTFNKNNTFEFSMNENVTKGTWSLSKDKKTLKTKAEFAEKKEFANIDRLTSEKLVYSMVNSNSEFTLKFKMSFVKIKNKKRKEIN